MQFLPLFKWIPRFKRPLVIAGPCSAESEEQVLTIAHQVKDIENARFFRAGVWKPRTKPGTFEGAGEVALSWMAKVKKQTGLFTCVEVANAGHVDKALKYNIDVLWIGARTTVSPFAVQEIADRLKGVNIPVIIKNPINADLALWEGALERIAGAGIKKICAAHRGFATGDRGKYRNRPLWRIPLELKRKFPDLPIICDPSHIAGDRKFIGSLCQTAMDVDMNGLMVETHHQPSKALSDPDQQITPKQLSDILQSLNMRVEYTASRKFESQLEDLREKIDRTDAELLDIVKLRMDLVAQIGKLKKNNNVTAFQVHRMQELINERMVQGAGLGLRKEYVKELYQVIHDEAVKKQTEILNKKRP